MIKKMKQWLHEYKINRALIARLIVVLIPGSCPFSRKVYLGKLMIQIPPLCKLNPLYEELVDLRFRALTFFESL